MLADKSGGQAWFPRFEARFPSVLQGVMEMSQFQHIMYESQIPSDGKFHRITVDAFQVTDDRRHDYKVRVREGWRF